MSSLPTLVPAFMPSGTEWIIILVIMLLLFGHKLPAMMRGLGGSLKEFKKGMNEGLDEQAEKPAAPPAPEGAVRRNELPAPATPAAVPPQETPKS